jgi:hypothetical protein
MRRLLFLGVFALTGCCSVVGPFERRKPEKVDDPCVSISEQEKRGRDRLAYPISDTRVAPSAEVLSPRGNP